MRLHVISALLVTALSALAVPARPALADEAPAHSALADEVPGREPVILVHGWAGAAENMAAMRDAFAAAGHPAYPVALPGEDNLANAAVIRDLVAEVRAQTGAEKVHLVGHSMGGLSARHYLKRLDGAAAVRTYVSMGTAQYGYLPACLLGEQDGGQMCPSSAFLRDLNAGDDTPGAVTYSTFRSSQENPRNVRLDGGACFLVIPEVPHSGQPAAPPFIRAALAAVAGTCPGTYVSTPPE